jgi:hypothetical protein
MLGLGCHGSLTGLRLYQYAGVLAGFIMLSFIFATIMMDVDIFVLVSEHWLASALAWVVVENALGIEDISSFADAASMLMGVIIFLAHLQGDDDVGRQMSLVRCCSASARSGSSWQLKGEMSIPSIKPP